MATCNGAKFIQAQLESIAAQDHENWSLWVSDDGSADVTRTIVERFRKANPRHEIHLIDGPRRGSAVNFLTMLARVDLPGDTYVAFSDQDDIWMPHKLSRALRRLNKGESGKMRVYSSRTMLMNTDGNRRRVSRRHRVRPQFGNALVQNILGGNTIVLDPAAAALMRRCTPAALAGKGVPFHDWWVYQVATGSGAEVICDDRPGLYYRQHSGNVLGANRGLRQGLARLKMIRNHRYSDWVDRNLTALWAVFHELTPESRALLEQFSHWRKAGGPLNAVGVGRQTGLDNILLQVSARFGWLRGEASDAPPVEVRKPAA